MKNFVLSSLFFFRVLNPLAHFFYAPRPLLRIHIHTHKEEEDEEDEGFYETTRYLFSSWR